jgi:KaiB domain
VPDEQAVRSSATRESSAHLILYVSPDSRLSMKARRNLESVLSGYDPEAVRLEIRDVTRDALQAEADRVVFTPTLVVRGPDEATAWVVGDLADADIVVNLLRLGGVERME